MKWVVRFLFIATAAHAATNKNSALWGEAGEKWTPDGRLPDFSHAGYRRGEEPFRLPTNRISVIDLGAKGDGRTDDSAAFRKAMDEGAGRLIEIPAGRYVLSAQLEMKHSGTVLCGAGSDRTVLLFRKPLEELHPKPAKTDGKQPTTGWSWGGGLITIAGPEAGPDRATAVVAPAPRGGYTLKLAEVRFVDGEEILLTVSDDREQSLLDYLYRGQPGDVSGLKNWKCRQVLRVRSVRGNEVTLDRPLRFEVRPGWKPEVQAFRPAVTDVGIEGVAFEFPDTPYGGHFHEVGFNPVEIGASAAHCWLRDLRIWNADSGPYIRGWFCTLDRIRLGADPERMSKQGHTGHHGITFYGQDGLCRNFSVETTFIHDLTVQSAMGCVFCAGRATNLSMDHHRWAPYENLFSFIDAGEGTRLFSSSGGGERGNHTAAGATFWNIRTREPAGNPRTLGIDAINVIGVGLKDPPGKLPAGVWYEAVPPGHMEPANLYDAMRDRRLVGNRAKP